MLVRASSGGSGGGTSLKDTFYDIVFNSGLTVNNFVPYSSRCTLNEGGVVIDTTNRHIYLYVDVNITANYSGTEYNSLASCSALSSNSYFPKAKSSTPIDAALIVDDSSTRPAGQYSIGYDSSPSAGWLRARAYTSGEHQIIYGGWVY